MVKKQFNFSGSVLKWFDAHGRKHLPWQQNQSAYRVWVSEIMLQQTQVAAVVPYYERFMTRFPTVSTLAKASLDEVLALWAGLGYYARGRNLHKTAQKVCDDFHGEFPNTVEALESLPGIGCSTAGAIMSLAFKQWAPILDGNVKRVLSRFYALEGWPGTTANLEKLWAWSEQLTPKKRTGDFNQAMMDIGATVCTRTQPKCDVCPLTSHCKAAIQGLQNKIPQSKPPKEKPIRHQRFCLILDPKTDSLLLQQRPPEGIWGGLWVCPEWPAETKLPTWLREEYQLAVLEQHLLPEFRHTFTHFHCEIQPVLAIVRPKSTTLVDQKHHAWYKMRSLKQVGLPAPIQKMIHSLTAGVPHDAHRILQKAQ